ncbi:COX15/CtaA family protein [Paenibacillus xylaniclasticus]|uniref:COX15/CtaA family protein n=1 Tax=Paenibacillus xylaniclasticus TaxID=588083 RepID=UPI000FD818C4|nr:MULTISPECIES: COX15/CtaA family protein [Paenibacillus]GFN31229.1 heme A synthase [Paenibacillus curdlanolyticus]
MISGRYRAVAVASCIIMLLVLLAGALVTNTESGRGCGDDWPLCNGKFVPAYTVESLIEYSHRAISGLAGMLTLATFLYSLRYKQYKEQLVYASAALALTIIQALMGAAAVLWPQSPAVMAIHFGISLLAFASTLLLVVWLRRFGRGYRSTASAPVPRKFYGLLLLTAIYSYVVVYLGAYIRHTDSSGGCLGWPLCNGQVIPDLEGATLAVFIHRVAAVILFILILCVFVTIRRGGAGGEPLRVSSAWALVLVTAQVLSGAWLTYNLTNEDMFVFTSLVHNLIIAGLFTMLLDMVIRSRGLRDS